MGRVAGAHKVEACRNGDGESLRDEFNGARVVMPEWEREGPGRFAKAGFEYLATFIYLAGDQVGR